MKLSPGMVTNSNIFRASTVQCREPIYEMLMILDYVTLASLELGKLDAYETNIYMIVKHWTKQ